MPLQDAIDEVSPTRVVQDAAAKLVLTIDSEMASFTTFRRAWIRDLGRLAREHQDDWILSAYAVQIIRQLQGRLPIG
jgi:hypothetical protein